ncbi:aspartyl protease family protein 1 isoform X2 [Dioscorea cayenensis subsp. rotundata]|uniref:Aspartyl protease family protein 1 isoform X2 n=1 Tax=Dioscorea cayennensis subsp. rotundata TaxID=55577 RepID=A0AB40CH92_DIOCR|nr:aspartyl protease family protein 1 isoform X2 [Dioscorea cayenensis subsp. rotundata]
MNHVEPPAISNAVPFLVSPLKPSPMAFPSLLLLLSAAFLIAGGSTTFRLDIHHRFSATVRRWVESRSGTELGWPEKGTVEYLASLAAQDRALRGRALSNAPPPLTFSEGNATIRINSLGFLHYAMVSVGTPSVTFLVALDTGSDLFWVPCDCLSCALSASLNYRPDFEFSMYSPNMSLTSQRVPCNSNLCELQRECSGAANLCPYKVAYVSADTSSSGTLVEDVLYLMTEDARSEVVEAKIIFGCGQVQTGSFLDVAAPNGLFGLGMEKVSVPSILASAGLTSDSFSICFGRDGVGRISFGDRGSSDQNETPFSVNKVHPTYNISIIGMGVGNTTTKADFSALVDTGTSFTYFADPAYGQLSQTFHAQVQDKRYAPDPRIPFEYCYYMSSNSTVAPDVSLTTSGGDQFPVNDPIIVISIQNEFVYCFAVVKSNKLNIIGQNFLTGLRIVFDRERLILGWKQFNCYDSDDSSPLPVGPRNSSRSPGAFGQGSYTPEATKEPGSGTQITVLTPPVNCSSSFNALSIIVLLLMLMHLVIL